MNKEFLQNLLTAYSPSGYEKNATSVFEDYMGTFDANHEFTDKLNQYLKNHNIYQGYKCK